MTVLVGWSAMVVVSLLVLQALIETLMEVRYNRIADRECDNPLDSVRLRAQDHEQWRYATAKDGS